MYRAIIKKFVKSFIQLIPFLNIRITLLRFIGYQIGKSVYVPADLKISDRKSNRNNIIIGDRVSIGPAVLLITDSSPNNSRLIKVFPLVSGSIFIKDDVWIGAGVIVLPNVTIGKCSVIGSGSVVTRDIPPFSIAAGIPAKVIKKIDENEL
jgi:acetyltransferase-like isoleucine patch superfamily enzyme